MTSLPGPCPAPNEYDEDAVVNTSANPSFDDILTARLSRRVALKGGISTTAAALLGGSVLTAIPTPRPRRHPRPHRRPVRRSASPLWPRTRTTW